MQRIKSTADIARLLYQLDGWSKNVEGALEFVVMSFMRYKYESDTESGLYALDQSTFRGIEVCNISNISGTISALRLLITLIEEIKERRVFRRIMKQVQRRISEGEEYLKGLDEECLRELKEPEIFISRRVDWLMSQQMESGAFPILSKNFAKLADKGYFPNWVKPVMYASVEKRMLLEKKVNVSLNNTIEAICLLWEFEQLHARRFPEEAFEREHKRLKKRISETKKDFLKSEKEEEELELTEKILYQTKLCRITKQLLSNVNLQLAHFVAGEKPPRFLLQKQQLEKDLAKYEEKLEKLKRQLEG